MACDTAIVIIGAVRIVPAIFFIVFIVIGIHIIQCKLLRGRSGPSGCGFPEVTVHNNGVAWNSECKPDTRTIGIMFENNQNFPLWYLSTAAIKTDLGYIINNLVSWLDWTRQEQYSEMFEFCKFMIHFRKAHPILRGRSGPSGCGFPEVTVHNNGVAWIIYCCY